MNERLKTYIVEQVKKENHVRKTRLAGYTFLRHDLVLELIVGYTDIILSELENLSYNVPVECSEQVNNNLKSIFLKYKNDERKETH